MAWLVALRSAGAHVDSSSSSGLATRARGAAVIASMKRSSDAVVGKEDIEVDRSNIVELERSCPPWLGAEPLAFAMAEDPPSSPTIRERPVAYSETGAV